MLLIFSCIVIGLLMWLVSVLSVWYNVLLCIVVWLILDCIVIICRRRFLSSCRLWLICCLMFC